MGDYGEKDKWVCPNDRELALRAKLQTGWSVKTGAMSTFTRQEQLNDSEQERIVGVIKRADMLEQMEQQRIGRLVERVENMKRNALGNGTTQCVLCANEFGLLSGSPLLCNDCRKAVCSKCSVDTFSAQREQIWLCKICSETREMWKKSGAWFYRALPNYVVPDKKAEGASKYSSSRNRNGTEATTAAIAGRGWHRGQTEKESTDSSDEESKAPKVNRRLISRKAMYDSTDSDSSAASPRIGASFPASPELASEKSRTGLEGASALEASYQDPGQALATDYVPSSRDMGAVARGEHSEVAPWRQRQHKDLSADDSDIDTGSCGRLGPYLVEDRSLDSLGSIGGTGRYVTAHLSRSPRRDPLDAEGDDSEYRADSSKQKSKSFIHRLRISQR